MGKPVDHASFVDKTFGRLERVPGANGYNPYVPAPLPRALQLDGKTTRALSETQTKWRTQFAGDRSYAPRVIDWLFATPFITTRRVRRAFL